jgi:hypothetical protein
MLRRVALVRTDVSKELTTSAIRLKRISELKTMLTLTIKCSYVADSFHPDDGGDSSSETSLLTRAKVSHPRRLHSSIVWKIPLNI